MIQLPYPDAALSPNARVHHMAKHRTFQKHKGWAHAATLASRNALPLLPEAGDIDVLVTAYPKRRNAKDRDNFTGRCKAYFDGIAKAIGVNDSRFDPRIQWGEPVADPYVIITLGECPRSFGEIANEVVARVARGMTK